MAAKRVSRKKAKKRTRRAVRQDRRVKAMHPGKRYPNDDDDGGDNDGYYESRPNRSDVNRSTRLSDGGQPGHAGGHASPMPGTQQMMHHPVPGTVPAANNPPAAPPVQPPAGAGAPPLAGTPPITPPVPAMAQGGNTPPQAPIQPVIPAAAAPMPMEQGGVPGNEADKELSIREVQKKIGRHLGWWEDDVITIEGQKYKKCFLRPYYKKTSS